MKRYGTLPRRSAYVYGFFVDEMMTDVTGLTDPGRTERAGCKSTSTFHSAILD